MSGSCNACAVICGLVILVVSAGLYGGSFKILGPHHAGLRKNDVTGEVSLDRVYLPGRYFLGLGRSFVTYPTNLLFFEFSTNKDADNPPFEATTQDGNKVVLEFSFFLRLEITQLPSLFSRYEQNYKAKYISVTISALQSVLPQFITKDYYLRRHIIPPVMLSAINNLLKKEFAVVQLLQLRQITFRNTVDQSIITRLVADQIVERDRQIKQSNATRKEIETIRATAQSAVNIINAGASAVAKEITDQANANAQLIRLNATAQAFKAAKASLEFTNDDLLQLIWLNTVRGLSTDSDLAVDLDSAFLQL